jgi:hypothetical protein
MLIDEGSGGGVVTAPELPPDKNTSMLRILLSFTWMVAVFLSLFQPKQFNYFAPGLGWYYPQDILFASLAFCYLISRRRIPEIPRSIFRIYLLFAVFSLVYLLTSIISVFILPSVDFDQMINGVARILLQYLIGPPLILCSLHFLFAGRKTQALRSFLVPSIVAGLIFIAGILLFLIPGNSPMPSGIREEILSQSWVQIGNISLFVPKWGATFAETQALGFFFFLSFLLTDIYAQRTPDANKSYYVTTITYFTLILFTASKGVLIGICIYFLLRNGRHLQLKAAALFLSLILGMYYVVHRVIDDPASFLESALSYHSLDERSFHALYFFKQCAEHPIWLLIGDGARQDGQMISRDYPQAFTHLTNPVSMFAVVTDSGLIGLGSYLAILVGVWLLARGFRERLAIASAFVANLWQPDWSMDCYILFMLIIAVSRCDIQLERVGTGPVRRSLPATQMDTIP